MGVLLKGRAAHQGGAVCWYPFASTAAGRSRATFASYRLIRTPNGAALSRPLVRALTAVRRGEDEFLPSLPRDISDLQEAVQESDARLLIIDPLMAFLGAEVNSYRDQDVRRAFAPIAKLAADRGLGVLVVRHLNKGSGGNPPYRGGASIGIIGRCA